MSHEGGCEPGDAILHDGGKRMEAGEAGGGERQEYRSFPVVGIGASAGGLEAFTQLLSHLPDQIGMAFVLIQHLDPKHESQLTELLSKATRLPVTEAAGGTAISPNHIYVIPPNTNLTIAKGILQLSPRGDARNPHLPIDLFFRSLAQDCQSQAIGVVLSGTGSDGSQGLAEIKAAGGITLAQDEKSAQYPSMPLNAASSSCIDYVLPPEAIARELVRISQHPYLAPAGPPESGPEVDRDYGKILARLRGLKGVDFANYRDTTIKRRIARRMALQQQPALPEYAEFLEKNPAEVDALYRDILINVTSFFRDPEVFKTLQDKVFPEIVRNKTAETPIRIWVPGCSSGQEPYSLAMALLEFLEDKPTRPPIQIFGTDISDAAAIERARLGFYPHSIQAEVSPERLRRFFTQEEGGYRIGKLIRDMCVFAWQNLAADPPFSHLDLISCRNVLIYLAAPLQNRIIPTLHYALNPVGFLLLGTSESVGRFTELFEPVDKHHNIYAKTVTISRTYPFGTTDYLPAYLAPARPVSASGPTLLDMQKEADRLVLGRYAPAGVLINEDFEILQFRGRTRAYLESPPGEATLNLLRMARDSLFLELRSAIDEAKKHNATVRREHVRVRDEHKSLEVSLEVAPIKLPGLPQRCFLVLFIEAGAPTTAVRADVESDVEPSATTTLTQDSEAAQLRHQLAETKDYLQAIIEQQNAANEELQSANEEIRSSNEELQSTNEELQTAKEELQSTNEELRTVNDELQARNREVSQLSDDLSNTLGSLKLPIVMLSRDLRIRSFTPAASALLNLLPTDVGRSFIDLRTIFDIPDLERMLLDVISTVSIKQQDIQDQNDRWHLLGMYPYRTSDHRIDGVVVSWVDIDERRRVQEQLQLATTAAEAGGRAKDRFLAVLSHELRTPLTPVLATVMMLQEDPDLSVEVRESLEVIRRNTDLEARLIDDLLDMTRITQGKIEVDKRPVELSTVVQYAVEVCKPDLDARRLHFGLEIAEGPLTVLGDSARLEQVFWNLLRNAVKFTERGGCVGVRVWSENGFVIVEVKDSGVGIAPEILARLFTPFEQGGTETTRQFGGLGLGLSISKTLIELHEGTIAAFSEGRGQGSTFRVVLPLHMAQVPKRESKRSAEVPATPTTTRPLRILLVDDHGDTLRILNRILTRCGHEVQTAGDIATGKLLAIEHQFDLLISDLGLPDGSGHQLVRELRALGQTMPAIALSGYGQLTDIEASRVAGFSAHLVKPVNIQQLYDAISRLAGVGTGPPQG